MSTISFKQLKQETMPFPLKIFLFLALIFPLGSRAQIGLTLGGINNQAPGWIIIDLNNASRIDLVGSAIYGGIDYEVDLNKFRLAILPEFNAAFYKKESIGLGTFTTRMYRFQINTHLYFLDFKGDCNCPTFSKKGSPLKKGLFLNISPGISFLQNSISSGSFAEKNQIFSPNIGTGIGYDMGLSKHITLTIFLNGAYYPTLQWRGLTGLLALPSSGNRAGSSDTTIRQISSGMTMRYHF